MSANRAPLPALETLGVLAALCADADLLATVQSLKLPAGTPRLAVAHFAGDRLVCSPRERVLVYDLLTYAAGAPRAVRDDGRALLEVRARQAGALSVATDDRWCGVTRATPVGHWPWEVRP